MNRYTVNQELDREDRPLYAGLLGIAIVAVIQFLQLSTLDTPLKISLYAFAVSIPLLALSISTITTETAYKYTVDPIYTNIAQFAGVIASCVGMTAIFWHFSKFAGIVFLVSGSYAFVSWLKFKVDVKRVNKEDA